MYLLKYKQDLLDVLLLSSLLVFACNQIMSMSGTTEACLDWVT